ncbi:phage tail protein [Cohnella thailandensis]|uniref:Phage tail protein n=1 Tax=Cohnella thailandensis TaxID=557557 RepID=A0A841SQR6_9BACL|nr:tail fiber protein [Cohnella thailandensis]MBB6634753.1 phage tail protein [Cohnella thailandensis]MBP1977895.1 microcystin-dependent protein [Cohnella thailandensis]
MDPYLGEIRLFAGPFAPQGWAFCFGQVLKTIENQALFTVIGNMYGGDGRDTFQLPDLRGRAPMHWGQGPGLTSRSLGVVGGETTVNLTLDQMPVHNHLPGTHSAANETSPVGAIWATTQKVGKASPKAYSNVGSVPMNPLAIGSTGGSQAHNNMQPFLELNFIIALEGIFPPKS